MRMKTALLGMLAAGVSAVLVGARSQPGRAACPSGAAPMILPPGFCATLYADGLAGPRHMVVAPNGDVFVAVLGGRGGGGGIVALRDTNHDGRADVRVQFGNSRSSEARLFEGALYVEMGTGVIRYPMKPGALEPAGPPDTIVSGLPSGGNHPFKTFAIDKNGVLYVNVGSATNVCDQRGQPPRAQSPDPCVERETRAGIWKFDARKTGQTQVTGEHFAAGVRNSVGMDIDPADNTLWVMQHGRDMLKAFPQWNDTTSAESPGEELFHVARGNDMGWPYCYFDMARHAKLLAPEYGGDGVMAGRCADKTTNVAAFPGHWAPDGVMFYRGGNLPAKYRSGVFIAFHGSWNREPLPQAGTGVVFQPLKGGRASGKYEIFADGFRDASVKPPPLGGRPAGIAEAPDGALYIADDANGRIWRVTYTGGR